MAEPRQIVTVEVNAATFDDADSVTPGNSCELCLCEGAQVVIVHNGKWIGAFRLMKGREQSLYLIKFAEACIENDAEQQKG